MSQEENASEEPSVPEPQNSTAAYRYGRNLKEGRITLKWIRFWMRYAGLHPFGRFATYLAAMFARPHKARDYLARMNPKGYISTKAVIYHADLQLGKNVFMDDRVVIFQRERGGAAHIGNRVCLYRDTIIETGYGGSFRIGEDSSIHPRCQLNAYVSAIEIGCGVMIAPNCAFYPYDHGIKPGQPIYKQPLTSKGPILVGDQSWLSVGVIVLGGVRIGEGAVIGAGAVVTGDIPAGAVALGSPARVVKMRSEFL
jgi:acetyltransferase-like isoleucine patch superfamily enzyme